MAWGKGKAHRRGCTARYFRGGSDPAGAEIRVGDRQEGQSKVWGKSAAVAGQRARRGGSHGETRPQDEKARKKFFLRLSCYVPSRAIKRGLLREVGVSIQAVGKSKTWVVHPRLGDMERRVGRVGRVRDPGKMQFPLGMPLAYLAAGIFCRWHTSCQLPIALV